MKKKLKTYGFALKYPITRLYGTDLEVMEVSYIDAENKKEAKKKVIEFLLKNIVIEIDSVRDGDK